MSSVIVNTGELFVGRSPAVIEAPGIGSCLVVCLYDETKKQGGLAHIMLPAGPETGELQTLIIAGKPQFQPSLPAKYADAGLDRLAGKLSNLGSSFAGLTAKIAGGAEMFTVLKDGVGTIGSQNLAAARQKLNSMGIKIISEDVGGNVGRSVKFFLETGDIEIRKKM